LLIVFFLTGLWHGANFTFIVWGLYFGIFLVAERLFLGKLLEKNTHNRVFNWLYTILVVMVGWVFFRAPDISYAFGYLGRMFGFAAGTQSYWSIVTVESILILPFALLLAGAVQKLAGKRYAAVKGHKAVFWTEFGTASALLVICILMLANNTYNPFIYFQF
jgi:alginate O-acetyltransferase complex protein AlgI